MCVCVCGQKRENLKGKILVANISDVRECPEYQFQRKYMIEIEHTSCSLFTVANSEEDQQAWIEAVKDACQLNGRFGSRRSALTGSSSRACGWWS